MACLYLNKLTCERPSPLAVRSLETRRRATRVHTPTDASGLLRGNRKEGDSGAAARGHGQSPSERIQRAARFLRRFLLSQARRWQTRQTGASAIRPQRQALSQVSKRRERCCSITQVQRKAMQLQVPPMVCVCVCVFIFFCAPRRDRRVELFGLLCGLVRPEVGKQVSPCSTIFSSTARKAH